MSVVRCAGGVCSAIPLGVAWPLVPAAAARGAHVAVRPMLTDVAWLARALRSLMSVLARTTVGWAPAAGAAAAWMIYPALTDNFKRDVGLPAPPAPADD